MTNGFLLNIGKSSLVCGHRSLLALPLCFYHFVLFLVFIYLSSFPSLGNFWRGGAKSYFFSIFAILEKALHSNQSLNVWRITFKRHYWIWIRIFYIIFYHHTNIFKNPIYMTIFLDKTNRHYKALARAANTWGSPQDQ